MTENVELETSSVGAWAKRCYFAGRALMDTKLRPYDLGATQWYVLSHLTRHGPTVQRDVGRALDIERATLSGVVATLVRKGIVCQATSEKDQRQRLLEITESGRQLWETLPDLSFIREIAFGGLDDADLTAAVRVLKSATERLQNFIEKENGT